MIRSDLHGFFSLKIILMLLCCIFFSIPKAFAEPLKGGVCYTSDSRPGGTFTCEHLGKVSVKEVYEKGWRVVSLILVPSGQLSASAWFMVIEEQVKKE
ncbi:MAG: hypothetical protein FWD67_08570 [Betaproteobacteria bacterium]|nr:hypothetical protein [Betaproteobacteria bacterium]